MVTPRPKTPMDREILDAMARVKPREVFSQADVDFLIRMGQNSKIMHYPKLLEAQAGPPIELRHRIYDFYSGEIEDRPEFHKYLSTASKWQ